MDVMDVISRIILAKNDQEAVFVHVDWIHLLKVSKFIVHRLVHGNEPISEDHPLPAGSTCSFRSHAVAVDATCHFASTATVKLRNKRLNSSLAQLKVSSCFIHVFWFSIMENWKVILLVNVQ